MSFRRTVWFRRNDCTLLRVDCRAVRWQERRCSQYKQRTYRLEWCDKLLSADWRPDHHGRRFRHVVTYAQSHNGNLLTSPSSLPNSRESSSLSADPHRYSMIETRDFGPGLYLHRIYRHQPSPGRLVWRIYGGLLWCREMCRYGDQWTSLFTISMVEKIE